jgi:acetyltransferase EpsM
MPNPEMWERRPRRAFVFGAGAHGRVVAETMVDCGVEFSAFLDDNVDRGTPPGEIHEPGEVPVYVAIGAPWHRALAAKKLMGMGFRIAPPLVHPAAYVAPSAHLGHGTVVLPGAVVHTGARIGLHGLINLQAIIHHDAVLEDFVTVSPQAQVCGRCHVEYGSLLAVRSCLLFPHRMGEHSILAADSVAFGDIERWTVQRGSPAAFVKAVSGEVRSRCF